MCEFHDDRGRHIGAGNRVRTGDLNLGKVALYQLSYSRNEAQIIKPSIVDRQACCVKLRGAISAFVTPGPESRDWLAANTFDLGRFT